MIIIYCLSLFLWVKRISDREPPEWIISLLCDVLGLS